MNLPRLATRLFVMTSLASACSLVVAQSQTPNPAVEQPTQVQNPGSQGISVNPTGATPQQIQPLSQSRFYLGAQQGFSYEDNVRGSSGGVPKISDWYSTTTLRAGVNQPISRQRVFGDAALRYNKYAERSELDNTGYTLTAGWDWATVGRLSGAVTGFADQNLTRPSMAAGQRNIERSRDLTGVARLGGETPLTFELGANARQVDHSSAAFALAEYRRTGAHGAVIYRVSPASSLGVGIGGSRSIYPFNGDHANRRDVYVQGTWTPTSQTDVQGRVGSTRNTFDLLTARNYTGVTGSVVVNHRPTGKIATSIYAARDTGGDVGFLRLTPDSSVSGANVSTVTTLLGARATWEVTGRIFADGGLAVQQRNFANLLTSGVLGSTGEGKETISTMQLGARWLPTRNISAGCQYAREARKLNSAAVGNFVTTSNPVNNIYGCFGAFTVY